MLKERVQFFCIHGAVHVFFYWLPRVLESIFIWLPQTLWNFVTGKRPLTHGAACERRIDVITTQKDFSASQKLMQMFGLRKDMQYRGPLYNGHFHTVLGGLRPARRVAYDRELLVSKDGNPICLDWLRAASESPQKGVILLIPGLGNYGQTNYMQRFARYGAQKGFHICILTPRGMGSAPLTTPNITCVTFTDDIRQVLRERLQKKHIAQQFGEPLPLYTVGYSCGGSTILKAMAEEVEEQALSKGALYPEGFPVEGIVAIIAPNDMEASAAMLRTKWGKRLYAVPIFTALKKYLRKHKEKLMMASEGKTAEEKAKMPLFHTDFEAAMRLILKPADVDRHIVATHFNYKDEFEYYKDGDALQYVRKIAQVPTLCINVRDDPIVGYAVTQEDWQAACNDNNHAVYMELPVGGHFGFVQDPIAEWLQPYSYLQQLPLKALEALEVFQHGKSK